MIWGIWAWWAIPLGLLGIFAVYRWMLQAAKIYDELVESCFDLYRFSLYKALHWPLPTNPDEERVRGKELSMYLQRGRDPKNFNFCFSEDMAKMLACENQDKKHTLLITKINYPKMR